VVIFMGAMGWFVNWAKKYKEKEDRVGRVIDNSTWVNEWAYGMRERLRLEEMRRVNDRRQERSEEAGGANEEALVSEALRLENEGLGRNMFDNRLVTQVDIINPLTPEIRCSNCRHSSGNNRGSLVESVVSCRTCNDHSEFIHIPGIAPDTNNTVQVTPDPNIIPGVAIVCSNCRHSTSGGDLCDANVCEEYSLFSPKRICINCRYTNFYSYAPPPDYCRTCRDYDKFVSRGELNAPNAPNAPNVLGITPNAPVMPLGEVIMNNERNCMDCKFSFNNLPFSERTSEIINLCKKCFGHTEFVSKNAPNIAPESEPERTVINNAIDGLEI